MPTSTPAPKPQPRKPITPTAKVAAPKPAPQAIKRMIFTDFASI